MKWLQFFTPVSSLTWAEAIHLADGTPGREIVFVDVRQPKEYQRGHLPGAILLPLGELENRLAELARDTPVVIY